MLAGVVALAVTDFAINSFAWSRVEIVIESALFGVMIYSLIPIVALGALVIAGRSPSTLFALASCVAWWVFLAFLLAYKPWNVEWSNLWSILVRGLKWTLPTALSSALAFSITNRRLVKQLENN